MQQVSPAQFKEWIAQSSAQGQPLILDVRETWECQLASIAPEGCEVQIVPMQTIPARIDELDKNRAIACLCHHGGRSAHVAMFLQRQGFADVYNLTGGVDAWARQVDPQMATY
jgi:rhodanese-related sulfurtransferase